MADIRNFDLNRGWIEVGQLSCAHWLSWRCGISLATGREKVRVAHALAELPKTDTALRDGFLSFSKARAITRLATPETEEKFLQAALAMSAAQFDRHCRLEAQKNPSDRVEPDRWVRVRETSLGMVRVGMMLRPDEAARLVEAMEAAAKDRADGIVAIVEGFLRGNEPTRPPTEVLVHIHAESLTGSQGDVGLPSETCRRILCDADIVPVVVDSAGTPVDIGQKKPRFSADFRRALAARDKCCRFPGCARTKLIEWHSITHWVDGGETTLENVVGLCLPHHKLIHRRGFRIVHADGDFRFFNPRGVEVPSTGAVWTVPMRAPTSPATPIAAPDLEGEAEPTALAS